MPESRMEEGLKPVPVVELFLRHVKKTETCSLWTAFRDKDGYGMASKGNGQTGVRRANRRAWEVFRGPIPDGMLVLHRCDNPPCVNPDHLFLGTNSDNMKDAHAKGRHKTPTQAKPESQVRGERQHLSKLKASDIPAIFSLHKDGLSAPQIAAKFGVGKHCVKSVLSRETWRHVEVRDGN